MTPYLSVAGYLASLLVLGYLLHRAILRVAAVKRNVKTLGAMFVEAVETAARMDAAHERAVADNDLLMDQAREAANALAVATFRMETAEVALRGMLEKEARADLLRPDEAVGVARVIHIDPSSPSGWRA